MNGDVHGGHAKRGRADRRFSIPDRSGHLFGHARRHPRRRARRVAPVGAGRHADQFGEAGAEGAQRRAADRETDLGDAEVAAAQQRHRSLDAPRHQIAVRRLAVGEAELAAEMPGRHVRAAGERLDVQRLRVLPVDPVADAAQPREVAQVLRRGGFCWSPVRSCHTATESRRAPPRRTPRTGRPLSTVGTRRQADRPERARDASAWPAGLDMSRRGLLSSAPCLRGSRTSIARPRRGVGLIRAGVAPDPGRGKRDLRPPADRTWSAADASEHALDRWQGVLRGADEDDLRVGAWVWMWFRTRLNHCVVSSVGGSPGPAR